MSTPRSVFAVAFTMLFALATGVPAVADAYATDAPPPSASPSSGLPDGRVYELTTPFNKHGFSAAIGGGIGGGVGRSIASPDGDAVSYTAKGPAAETNSSGTNYEFVAERTTHGWASRSAVARGLHQNEEVSGLLATPSWLDYTPDLAHLVYDMAQPEAGGDAFNGNANLYLLGSDPLAEPTWILRDAIQIESSKSENKFPFFQLLGTSPDASIVYLADGAQLLPQDASRSGEGIYEYRNGHLSEAGVLPDGSVPASGSWPPSVVKESEGGRATRLGENDPASFDNQVSEDGKRVFFISSHQLYVHEIQADGSERSVLVSASQMPGHIGEAAPDGVSLFENPTKRARPITEGGSEPSGPTYAYAAPDGSHVFFKSADPLTSDAPSGSEMKIYDFDVDTESLEYLPGVNLGGIVTAASDGSSFVFVNGVGSSPDLDLWSDGPGGGSVHQIAQLPGGGFVGPGRMVAGNSVLVFQAQAPIAGFNNSGGEQVYRYEVKTDELDCISCPPDGVKPSGDSYLSSIDQYDNRFDNPENEMILNDTRGVSSDGERIFFDSPDALVGRDTNGNLDAYEWEKGALYLLSSGTSPEASYFLDNSQSGGDVFIATSDELTPGDNDGARDIYDARIPRPGDTPPPAAAACSGSACQGPPSVPQLLGAPPSAIFNGVGNVVEERPASVAKSAPKRLSRPQKLASALRLCGKRRVKSRRIACERQARKRYSATGSSIKLNRGRGK